MVPEFSEFEKFLNSFLEIISQDSLTFVFNAIAGDWLGRTSVK